MNWVYLLAAILAEVGATCAMKASEGFARLGPAVATVLGYAVAFTFLSLALRTIPVGIAYAVWSGVGIVLIALVGWVVFGQRLDLPAVIGLGLILAGVVVINVFSKAAAP